MARDVYHVRKTRYQKCIVCNDGFWTNKPAETCSNACRQVYYRARRKAKEEAAAQQPSLL